MGTGAEPKNVTQGPGAKLRRAVAHGALHGRRMGVRCGGEQARSRRVKLERFDIDSWNNF